MNEIASQYGSLIFGMWRATWPWHFPDPRPFPKMVLMFPRTTAVWRRLRGTA